MIVHALCSMCPVRTSVKRVRAKTIQVECIGSTHDNLLSQLWPYESDVRVTRQAASDSWTAGCTLASGTHLA